MYLGGRGLLIVNRVYIVVLKFEIWSGREGEGGSSMGEFVLGSFVIF